ncbi:MAG: hypothetical protein [Caudoviricetes sp.]|nr:MAG: hypothetical protein [Caudoviricetes sp.]
MKVTVADLVGKKFEIVAFIEGDKNAYYGAKIGDVITVGKGDHFPNSVWALQSENPGVFTDPEWAEFEQLCLAGDVTEFMSFFKEVV